ncbi:MAG: hypothetical protein WC644_02015 [Ignavibacteria bacterium]
MNYENTVPYIPAEEKKERTGSYSEKEYKIPAREIEKRIKHLNKNNSFPEFTEIKITDGISEVFEPDTESANTESANSESDNPATDKTKTKETRKDEISQKNETKCFINDDTETQKKKIKAIEEFYSDRNQLECVDAILRDVFCEVFSGVEIDETAEDEVQNAAEAFLTKRAWDVEKHPDYRRQLLYTIKFNLIPNMLNKYFGLKIKDLSDDELQARNFAGEGLRGKPTEKNYFRHEFLGDFDINEENGVVVYNTESNDGIVKIHGSAYMTAKEKLEDERLHTAFLKKMRNVDNAVSRCKDEKLKLMYKMLKKGIKHTNVNVVLAKSLNMTINEVIALKKKLARFLRQKVKADVRTYKKAEYNEKLAMMDYKN